ncbi:class I SAM-dependent methyltransferase [Rubrivirga sp. IMCC43871]|uniref:class I SAM-dependent methyltransferase n=1 Tax=Rubrivirga sp. IMCC43871 TaxID=3391575 RepID=UPI0039900462
MHPDLQRRVQRYGWDKAAHVYEPYWREPLAVAQRQLLDWAALRPGQRVADVACGTGLVTLDAARAVGDTGEVVATDLSDAMVAATTAAAAREGLAHVTALRADAEALPGPGEAFDVALCALGLMYVPDPRRAMREMHRVLRPGGRAVAAVWGRRDRCGWAELFSIVDHRVSSDVCPMFFQLGGEGALEREFTEAGFADVEAVRLSTVLRYTSADDACGAAFLGGPVAMAYARFDEPTRAEAHEEYLASIAEYRDGDGYAIPGEFVVARGIRPAG